MTRTLLGTVCVLLGICSTILANTCVLEDSKKVDCGFAGVNADSCLAKGCCWQKSYTKSNTPWCYQSGSASTPGYDLQNYVTNDHGFTAKLSLRGQGLSPYGADIQQLALNVNFVNEDVVQVKLTDASKDRWEVPESILPRPALSRNLKVKNYDVAFTSSPFSLTVTRLSDKAQIFALDSEMIYKDQYLEATVKTDEKAKTFGIGESTRLEQALKVPSMHTLWAADIAAQDFYTNLYGSYPYYVQLLNGQAHGAMLLNSNGMDVSILKNQLKFQIIGGVLDFYVFTGPTPEQVVQQYTSVVGKPTLQPFWSFGFHNCRWGYESLNEIKEVVQNYTAAGIPLETQWADIDYMQDYRDFTLDAADFPQDAMRKFVDDLHAKGQKFVPIIDPGIEPFAGYDAYEEGIKQEIFIRDITGDFFLGQVWPGPTNFPDFLNPKIQPYWSRQIKNFLDKVPVDGLWIDMNEVSNFCNGAGTAQTCALPTNPNGDCPDGCCIVCKQVDASNKLDYPPYNINNDYGILGIKTLSMAAYQYDNITYYNAHNLYGISEQIATRKALIDAQQKRPFVLSRSSFLSTGVHSAKWTGDNAATWDDLKSSIISMFDFNLFGVPMIGSDICGFNEDTNEELCARWIEVGAFYPFSRDHNAIGALSQELYRWDSVAEAGRKALTTRYQLLPFLYTLFYQAHTQGSTVVRALWNNYPSDNQAVDITGQFMWGKSLLFSPVLKNGDRSVNAYFPAGLWYSFEEGSSGRTIIDSSNQGKFVSLSTPLTSTNVHISGGSILPLQQAKMTTTESRSTPFSLLVALCPKGLGYGNLFWDDGEQLELKNSLVVEYKMVSTGVLQGKVLQNSLKSGDVVPLTSIEIVGKDLVTPSKVTLNGQSVPFKFENHALKVSGLSLTIADSFSLTWE